MTDIATGPVAHAASGDPADGDPLEWPGDDSGEEQPRLGPARAAALAAGVVVVALLGLFIYGVATKSTDEDPTAPSPLDGRVAPALSGTALDGNGYSLIDRRGSWVVVNFFSTTCVPCVQEHPQLVEFAARHAAAGDRQLVSVVFGGPAETDAARQFFTREGGDWPVVPDPTGQIAVDYAVAKVPESILVAPSGVVLGKIRGGVTADALDNLLDDVERQAGVRT